MAISENIYQYIENSKIRGKLCRWKKSAVNVYITEIVDITVDKTSMYNLIEKAIAEWNTEFYSNNITIKFQRIYNAQQADIIIKWCKVGRVYEGMCNYVSVIGDELRKISIDIGLANQYGKSTTDLSIFCAIMHEFGHSIGLGHGVDINDIMYVPHQKNIQTLSDNDIFVLKEIYK